MANNPTSLDHGSHRVRVRVVTGVQASDNCSAGGLESAHVEMMLARGFDPPAPSDWTPDDWVEVKSFQMHNRPRAASGSAAEGQLLEQVRRVVVEIELEPPWTAIVHVESQTGTPVIASVEVRPTRPLTLDAFLTLEPETAPACGLPAKVYGSLSFSEVRSAVREALHRIEPDLLALHGLDSDDIDRELHRRGPRGREPVVYAKVAQVYADLVFQGERYPVRVMADRSKRFTYDQLHEMVRGARSRGLLTQPGRGKVGGELTDEADRLLAEHDLSVPAS